MIVLLNDCFIIYLYNIVKINFCFHFKLSIPAKIPAIFKISNANPGTGIPVPPGSQSTTKHHIRVK